ncbi:dinucleotide-utilizing protein [Leptospira yanagawae]|uniref:Dinucleotide-utilizing protein n=1 Tax=Leptospira yanagawae TaxID=293069 RepID=A0ABY2M004_9LEPT|nr:HesA/MoeB/ThiF family protein [Leptospira yanagawae]TGL19936.1 dinucleotide-utilizing protein [Leptospira yanagawae]
MNIDKNKFFQRQSLVPEIGEFGQKKWAESSVLIIGLGGLGCPSALQLAVSGIGKIGLLDFDVVEVSNLHRQTLFTWKHIGRKKNEVAAEVIKEHVPWIQIEIYSEFVHSESNPNIFQTWDIVLDCTDTIASKYAINDICLKFGIPLVTASVFRTSAQFALFSGKGKPCYRCLFPDLSEGDTLSCNEGGVLGLQASIAGNYQASLALQYLLNPNQFDSNSVYFIEWNPITFYESKLDPNTNCICDNTDISVTKPITKKMEVDFEGYNLLKNKGSVVLLDVREREEVEQYPIKGVLHFPLSEMKKGNLPDIEDNQIIVCICESGIRSNLALSFFPHHSERYSFLGGRKFYMQANQKMETN